MNHHDSPTEKLADFFGIGDALLEDMIFVLGKWIVFILLFLGLIILLIMLYLIFRAVYKAIKDKLPKTSAGKVASRGKKKKGGKKA